MIDQPPHRVRDAARPSEAGPCDHITVFAPVADYVPHRPPILMIDEIVEVTPDGSVCRATLRPDCPFAIDGQVHPAALIEIAAQAFAKRGRAAETLRDLMYRLMGLEPPHAPVRVAPVPPPVPEPRVWEHAERPALVATASVCGGPGDVVVRVERYPAELEDLHTGALPGLHLVVDGTEPDPRLRDLADIVIHRHDARGLPDGERSTQAVAEVTARGTCVFRPPGGPVVELSPVDPRGDLDPGTYASAARAWATAGRALTDLPRELTVAAGPIEAVVRSRLVSG